MYICTCLGILRKLRKVYALPNTYRHLGVDMLFSTINLGCA